MSLDAGWKLAGNLKSANVLMTRGWQSAKLSDVGMTRLASARVSSCNLSMLMWHISVAAAWALRTECGERLARAGLDQVHALRRRALLHSR